MSSSNAEIRWTGIAKTVAVQLLILGAVAYAVVRYVEWSSDAAVAEFMSAAKLSSNPNDADETATLARPLKRRTACSVDKGSGHPAVANSSPTQQGQASSHD